MAVPQQLVLRQEHNAGAKCAALYLLQSSLGLVPLEWALFTEGGGVVAKTRPLKKMQTRNLTGALRYVKLEVRKPRERALEGGRHDCKS